MTDWPMTDWRRPLQKEKLLQCPGSVGHALCFFPEDPKYLNRRKVAPYHSPQEPCIQCKSIEETFDLLISMWVWIYVNRPTI